MIIEDILEGLKKLLEETLRNAVALTVAIYLLLLFIIVAIALAEILKHK